MRRSPWWALAPLLLGTFTGTVTNSVVNVGMTEILRGLGVPLSRGALVVVAFSLTFAVLMPLTGWLGDRLGRRRVFVLAMVGLAGGAVGAALAPDLPTLVAWRAVQGAATACVLPTVMSMIAATVGPEQCGRALGWWAAGNGAGQAAGPALGGILAGLDWRAIFWPTVPLALLALVLVLWLTPHDRPRPVPLEWRGALLLTGSAALLLGAGSAVPPLGIGSPVVWASAAAGLLTASAYVLVERNRPGAFLRPGLLVEARYLRSSFAVLAQMFSFGTTLLAVPLHLTLDQHRSTVEAGLLVLSLPVAMMTLSPVAGICIERLGPLRALRSGLVVLLVGQLLLAGTLTSGAADVVLVAVLVVVGAGVAFVQTPAATGATRSAAGQFGAGLGLFNLVRFGGSGMGAAWVAVVSAPAPPAGLVFGVCAAVVAAGLGVACLRADPADPIVRVGARRQTREVAETAAG